MRFQTPTENMTLVAALHSGSAAANTALESDAVVAGLARLALVIISAPTTGSREFFVEGRTNDPSSGQSAGAWTRVKNLDASADLSITISSADLPTAPRQGLLYLAELPYDEYRIVAEGAAAVTGANAFVFLLDHPEYPVDSPMLNAWASLHGPGARAAALS